MNNVVLVGNLASDVEMREVGDGRRVASFRLAVQRRFANQQGEREADFFPIVVWGKAAEACARYLTKGKKAGVGGRLQVRSYQGQDGGKRYVTEVVAEQVEFLSPAQRESGGDDEKLRDVQTSSGRGGVPGEFGERVRRGRV